MKRFEEIEHTADWAFRAYGRDLKDLFENAAFALFALEGATDGVTGVTRHVQVRGRDYESLLVNWLSELVFLQDAHGETFSKFTIHTLTSNELSATIEGGPSIPLNKLVKAVTYHDLRIEPTVEGYQATVVVDV